MAGPDECWMTSVLTAVTWIVIEPVEKRSEIEESVAVSNWFGEYVAALDGEEVVEPIVIELESVVDTRKHFWISTVSLFTCP